MIKVKEFDYNLTTSYPCLKRARDSGLVVLFTSPKNGVVIVNGIKQTDGLPQGYESGEAIQGFLEEMFEKVSSITFIQD